MLINIKMEKKKKDLLYFVVLFVCLISVFYLIFVIKSQVAQCVKNPYIYGASKMQDVECSCLQYNNKKCPATFSFNDTEFRSEVTYCEGEKRKEYIEAIDWDKINALVVKD